MEKQRKKLFILLFCVLVLALLLILFFFRNLKGAANDYDNIPVGGGKLEWGMTKDEIIEVLGEPSNIEEQDSGVFIDYNQQIKCDWGTCSEVKFAVGSTIPYGLGVIQITIEDTTLETLNDKLDKSYGILTTMPSQGEEALKQDNPNFFWKTYYSEDWRINMLSEENIADFSEYYKTITGFSLDITEPLMSISIHGVADEETYPCKVVIDATLLSGLQYVLHR